MNGILYTGKYGRVEYGFYSNIVNDAVDVGSVRDEFNREIGIKEWWSPSSEFTSLVELGIDAAFCEKITENKVRAAVMRRDAKYGITDGDSNLNYKYLCGKYTFVSFLSRLDDESLRASILWD